jgi:hypothetical protein
MATKGLVYLLVGGLAVQAAAGRGGRVADSRGAVRTLEHQPFGDGLLVAVAIGFGGYALWRVLQAALDLEGKRGLTGAARRVAYAVSACIYGGLALTAIQLALGDHPRGHEPGTWVARALAQPYGDLLVGAAGLGFIGYAAVHLGGAVTARFRKHLDLAGMSEARRALVTWVGRIGTAARGVVFGLIGYHLVKAAVHARPGETRNVGGALRALAARPHGEVLLGVTAGGLFLYGVFMLVWARCGRIPGSTDGG